MKFRQFVALCGAMLCFTVAAALLARSGLPGRAEYTGVEIGGVITAPEIGAHAPDFRANLLDGRSLSLQTLRGTPVILNFWATWCQPCAIEMPILQRLHEEYPPGQLRIIAINTGETADSVATWAAQLQLSLEIALDPDLQIMSYYYVRGQPQTFVLDQHGIIRDIFFGAVDYAMLNTAIRPLFQQP